MLPQLNGSTTPLGLIASIRRLDKRWATLVHQVRGWYSGGPSRTGTNAYFAWMREAKREHTRCGLGPMSDKAAGRKTRGPERCDENGPAAALLLGHVSIQICSLFRQSGSDRLAGGPV